MLTRELPAGDARHRKALRRLPVVLLRRACFHFGEAGALAGPGVGERGADNVRRLQVSAGRFLPETLGNRRHLHRAGHEIPPLSWPASKKTAAGHEIRHFLWPASHLRLTNKNRRPKGLLFFMIGVLDYLLTRTTRKREMLQKSSMLSIWMLSVPSSSSTMV